MVPAREAAFRLGGNREITLGARGLSLSKFTQLLLAPRVLVRKPIGAVARQQYPETIPASQPHGFDLYQC